MFWGEVKVSGGWQLLGFVFNAHVYSQNVLNIIFSSLSLKLL